MTHRERLLNILEGKQPECLPWYGDLDYWANSLIKRVRRVGELVEKYGMY